MPEDEREWSLKRFKDKISEVPLEEINDYLKVLSAGITLWEKRKEDKTKKFQLLYNIFIIIMDVKVNKLSETTK